MTTPVYDESSPVEITVQIPTYGGNVITPTSISYVVTDETGVVIQNDTAVTIPDTYAASFTISILGSLNTLTTGTPFALRQIITSIVAASGTYTDSQTYLVRGNSPLVRMTNTFVTLPETELVRYQLMSMDAWDASTEDQRIAAMVTAYKNMLQMRYRFPIGENYQSRIVDFYGMSVDNIFGRIYIVLAAMEFYNQTDYAGWPQNFKDALQRAQMAEANYLLGENPILDKRRQGITAETIGESSMTFNKIPDIVKPVCREALKHLRGFLNNSTLIGRG